MGFVRSVFWYDPFGWRPISGFIRFVGVAVAVAIGGAVGGPGASVLAGLGALYAGMASFGGVHQARLKRMLAATFTAGMTTYIGGLVEPSVLGTIATMTVGAFLLSLLAAAGSDAALVAIYGVGILAVFSGLHSASANPLGNSALVLGGGLGMCGLLMLVHPISPAAAERRAVESVYAGLAAFARDHAAGENPVAPSIAPHADARASLRDGLSHGLREEHTKLWADLELADALRGNLVGLARSSGSRELWSRLADWLDHARDQIARGRPIDRDLPLEGDGPWLRRIARMLAADPARFIPAEATRPRSWLTALRNVDAIRALAFGHALRFAVTVGVAVAVYKVLRIDHGYWAVIAVAFSLKPDFATTITRGAGRIVGTAAGVLLATAFAALVHPSKGLLTGAMLVSTWLAFSLQTATYVGFSTCLAFYVVMSVSLSGMATSTVGLERLAATAAGAILAIVAAVAWPNWEAGRVRELVARACEAQADYGEAVDALRRGAGTAEAASNARFMARGTRIEAERLLNAAGLEPRWARGKALEGLSDMMIRLAENAARILAVHAQALDPHPNEPEAESLADVVAEDRRIAALLLRAR